MHTRNILGIVGALFFASFSIYAISDGYWWQGFAIVSLWIAGAYWRRGEGLDDSYNKQQAFISGGFFGLIGLNSVRLDDLSGLDDITSTVLMLYLGAASLLLVRLLDYLRKHPTITPIDTNPRRLIRFFLFQPPEQVREHTRG
jgi:hypothetical protein